MSRTDAAALAADTDGRPLIARNSLVMLGARGGRGKTTHFIDWMVHLALGEDYLCFTIPTPARILVIENEGPGGAVRREAGCSRRAATAREAATRP